MICLSARVADRSQGIWYFGAQLDCYVSASSLYVPSSDPREAGDNSSGLRSGSGAEWK